MDKRTLLAVVLSVVIIVGGMILQSVLAPPKPARSKPRRNPRLPCRRHRSRASSPSPRQSPRSRRSRRLRQLPARRRPQEAPAAPGAETAIAMGKVVETAESAPPASQPATIQRDTDLYSLTFETAGGTLSSVRLRKYKNVDGSPVDMLLLPKTMTPGELPFALAFGDYKSEQLTVPFALHETTDSRQVDLRFHAAPSILPRAFRSHLHKTYLFYKDEYLFQLQITIENSVNDFPALDFGGLHTR